MYILLLIAISVSVAPPRQSAHKFGIRLQSTWHPQLNELVNFLGFEKFSVFVNPSQKNDDNMTCLDFRCRENPFVPTPVYRGSAVQY